jgi:hypothetical protein
MTAGYDKPEEEINPINPDEWYDSHENYLGPSYTKKKPVRTWDEHWNDPGRTLPPRWDKW